MRLSLRKSQAARLHAYRRRRVTVSLYVASALWIGAAQADAAQSSRVVMMVGGIADDNDDAAAFTPTRTRVSAAVDSTRVSVVLQPRAAQSAAATVSRVLALAPLIDEAARSLDMDSALLMAVIDVESSGDPLALSPKGAAGLMQLMPRTALLHGAADLFDPRQNIAAGAHFLRQLLAQFGDLRLALAAYNAGEGAVRKFGGTIPPYPETVRYVPRVIERYRQYRQTMQATHPAPGSAVPQTAPVPAIRRVAYGEAD
ncbi:MAG TPA: lytic transglycosylase domain-containing protein [Paraburkholderia sp.]|jgi:soluble lytic murein transglycosylase-like protein